MGRHRYYSLTRWKQWQSLSIAKITPSKHPAPPINQGEGTKADAPSSHESNSFSPEKCGISLGIAGESDESAAQYNLSQYNLSQYNLSQRKPSEVQSHEDQPVPPPNVIPFPPCADDGDGSQKQKEAETHALADQVTSILQLPASPALYRLVQDFAQIPHLSLTGEADAAREWIDDRQRNRKGKRMSPAFFRECLKRERASSQQQPASHGSQEARETTGTDGNAPSPPTQVGKGLAGKSLMHLEQQYRVYQAQRKQDLPVCSKGAPFS